MAKFIKQDQGSNTIEYALLVGLIALVCIPALLNLSNVIGTFWDAISARLLN